MANVATTLFLIPRQGVVGVAEGTAIGWIAFAATFAVIDYRAHPRDRACCGILAADVLIGMACSAALHCLVAQPWLSHAFGSRILGVVVLGASGVAYVAAFLSFFCGSVVAGVSSAEAPHGPRLAHTHRRRTQTESRYEG